MSIRIISIKIIFLLAIFFTVVGCSTKKNTPASRAYHNVTAKYNYYFNANESYTIATKRASKNYSYNYTIPIPVSLAGSPQVASMVGGDMDRAILKCTDLIRKHSITIKPERKSGTQTTRERKFYNQNEFIKWARKAWLLIGKARVWKGALDEASMTFEYILTQFPETPMWHEANIWLARIDIIKNDLLSAEDRLRTISNNRRYPKSKHFVHLLESSWADLYFRQENYQLTTKHLEKALQTAPDKDHRIRYTFLMAQLKQKEGKLAESNALYRKVIRMSSSYDMSFNARVNIASNNAGSKRGSDMKRQLLKMAKDEKNLEYLDQIYYTLGNIEQSDGNMDAAIEYFKLSAVSSVNNDNQKGLSYLILADYYFARPNYTISQAYYDSAYNALDPSFPGYKELEIKTLNLNRLVENLNVIQNEDSLLRIAAMSPRERDAIIAELIKKAKEDEDREKRELQEGRDRFSQFQQTQRGRTSQTQEGGGWYFYNQSSLSFGLSEFNMKWGRRKLEDNWRRVNKRIVIDESLASSNQETDDSGEPKKILDNKSREFYLQDLPLTDSLVAISNKRIVEAMFRVGEVYETLLKDYPEAINAYERLVARFPQETYSLQSLYNLYQIARFTNKPADAERYKQAIIANFPSSPYAQMLSNPNYIEEMRQKEQEQTTFYQQVLNLYSNGNFIEASRMAQTGLERYPGSDFEPLFLFIYAQGLGKSGEIRRYKDELSRVVDLFPKSEVAKSAKEIIAFLDKRELQLATGQLVETTERPDSATLVKPSVIYKQPEGKHLFLAIVPKTAPLNQLRFNIVSFNVEYYINLNLNVASKELSQHLNIISVDPLKDKDAAMEYFRKASAEQGLMGSLPETDYTLVVISESNFEILLKDKSVVDYLNFFRLNYK